VGMDVIVVVVVVVLIGHGVTETSSHGRKMSELRQSAGHYPVEAIAPKLPALELPWQLPNEIVQNRFYL
jgi:hypothetical protein